MGTLRRLYRDLAIAWHRPGHWRFRPASFDRRAFRDVVVENEYRLPRRLRPGAVVMDIGANVGTFALAALRRGAGLVVCCEPDAGNFEQLCRNLAPFADRTCLRRCAVWRSDVAVGTLTLGNPDVGRPDNTGAVRVTSSSSGGGGQQVVPAVAFDELVAELTAEGRCPIDLVKLDCEGAEWPILYTSQLLGRVRELVGEYHLGELPGAFDVPDSPPRRPEALADFLRAQGLTAEVRPCPAAPDRLGHWFARRPD